MNCKQCNTPLGAEKRADAVFCDHNCQQGYFKRKKRILEKIKKLKHELVENEKWMAEEQQKLDSADAMPVLPPFIQEDQVKKLRKELNYLNKILKDKNGLFQQDLIKLLDQNMEKFDNDYGFIMFGSNEEKRAVVNKHYQRYTTMAKKSKEKLKKMERELDKIRAQNNEEEITVQEIKFRLEKAKKERIELEERLTELEAIDVENLPPKFNPKKSKASVKKTKRLARGVSGEQIKKMKFDTIRLSDELGQFLGELQREKCAIALTGDSGAGKSTFSYQLAKAFLDQNLSVGYFSLESGITENTQKLIKKFEIDSPKFEVYAEGGLEDVRTLALKHDCIIVDSYSKISSKAEDFENLRQDFPNTFFIIIFQKTTDGKIRGGASIVFNSTATIDIKITSQEHRIAIMDKSRYGTENFVYSITNDNVLKNDTIPIKWSEIEKKWVSPIHD